MRMPPVFHRLHGGLIIGALVSVATLWASAQAGFCDPTLANGASFVFASVEQGQSVLTTRDDFIERMSGFDRAARVKTDQPVSEEEFMRFVRTNVLAWSDQEKATVNAAIEELRPSLDTLALPLPKTILLVRTTGREEGGQQYTRSNAIMLNASILRSGPGKALKQAIAHELFHVLSRSNPEMRERCYAAIGFKPCAEVTLPATLGLPRLTDPDAPKNNHYIEVSVAGREVEAIPLLYSQSMNYDVQKGGEFFAYVEFKFLTAPRRAGPPAFSSPEAQWVDPNQLSGFFEQIGTNTQYIIHPEEILADNFSLLVRGERGASRTILDKLKTALRVRD